MKKLLLSNEAQDLSGKEYITFNFFNLSMGVGEEFMGTIGEVKYLCKVVEKTGNEYKCEFESIK